MNVICAFAAVEGKGVNGDVQDVNVNVNNKMWCPVSGSATSKHQQTNYAIGCHEPKAKQWA